MRRAKQNNNQLRDVIGTRLTLQYTQRRLDEMGVAGLSMSKLTSKSFLDKFHSWDNDKKKDFIFLIGGRNNIGRTFYFLHESRQKLLAPKTTPV